MKRKTESMTPVPKAIAVFLSVLVTQWSHFFSITSSLLLLDSLISILKGKKRKREKGKGKRKEAVE